MQSARLLQEHIDRCAHITYLLSQVLTLLFAEAENNQWVVVALHAHTHNLVDVGLLTGAVFGAALLVALA